MHFSSYKVKSVIISWNSPQSHQVHLDMQRSQSSVRFLFRLGIIFTLAKGTLSCVTPLYGSSQENLTVNSTWELYKGPIEAAASSNVPGILDYTGPKQVRAWLAVMAASYTASAYYHESALNFFGEENADTYRRCQPTSDSEKTFFENDALLTFAYTYLWGIKTHIPEWSSIIDTYATEIGINLSVCPSVSSCSLETPEGLARVIVVESDAVFAKDGWNADGLLSKTHNTVEFEEWREPNQVKDPNEFCVSRWKLKRERCDVFGFEYGDDICWRPQVHQIGDFLYEDTYLMQHIADTGRSYFLGDTAMCDLRIEYPCIDEGFEAEENLRRLSELKDDTKAQIELFDNIWNWMNIFITKRFDAASNETDWEIIKSITASIAAMYEVTLVVWKEKLAVGMIRPKSLIGKRNFQSSTFSYLGPEEQDYGDINGEDWVPYSNKHAQTAGYPSHHSCMCSVFASAMSQLSDSNSIIPGDGSGIAITREAGSSSVETNKPDENVTFSFRFWSDMTDSCHESVLNTGTAMSITKDAAKDFCAPITPTVVNAFDKLEKGEKPAYTIDTQTLTLTADRCNESKLFFCYELKQPTIAFFNSIIDSVTNFLGIDR